MDKVVFKSVPEALEQIEAQLRIRRYGPALELASSAATQFPETRVLDVKLGQLLEVCKEWEKGAMVLRHVHTKTQEAGGKTELPVLVSLANCLLQLGQLDQARKLFDDLRRVAGDQPKILAGLATIARRHDKDIDKAEALSRLAVSVAPDDILTLHEMAEVLLARDRTEEALQVLERNIRRKDVSGTSIDLWLATLEKANRKRYAQDTLEELMKVHPDVVEFAFGYARLASMAGEISLARPALERAMVLSPNNPYILYELGILERLVGNYELSQELIRQALDLRPDTPAVLRTYLSEIKIAYGDDNYRRLQYVAAKMTDYSPFEQTHMHYALAKGCEDVGDLETAFRHYAIAGVKKRKIEPFNDRELVRMSEILPKVLAPQEFAKDRQEGFESDVPVFIVGMPRSGTSLLEQILSAHPDIFGAGELKLMPGLVENIQVGHKRLRMNEHDPVFPYDENASWARRGQHYVDRLFKIAGKPYKRIVDKMPGNYHFVPIIKAILPNARIIHSRRHPVETCLSCYRIHFAEGHQWSYNLRELGRFYRRYWDLTNTWREMYPDAMYEVRYEDNVADVEGQARRLIDYLGLEWNDNCLKFHEVDRPVMTASVTQVRKPIYTTSTNRWRKYEKYLGPLLHELGDIVEQYEAEIAHLGPKAPAPAAAT